MVRWSINIPYHEDSQILFFCRIHTCLEEAENERMHLMYLQVIGFFTKAQYLLEFLTGRS